jgi:hypothetical protein
VWAQALLGVLSGSTVPGARLRVTSVETGRVRELIAGPSGRFVFAALPIGALRVKAEAPGFETVERELVLAVNQEIDLELALPKSGERQTVEVRSMMPMLKTDTAAAGGAIANQQIVDLPLDGRNYYELALLLPGVVPPALGSAGSVRGDFAVNVNGAREDGNLFLLDGVYNGDPKLNGVGLTSPVDAIREFEVASSTYDASFGRNAGGQVNVVLKSGSNALHGTAYEFFRNDSLDARNFFAPAGEPDPRYQRNQFGGSLGGPLRRDRTFLFGDYEGRRTREGVSRVTNVPTLLERNGDFSQSGVPYIIDPFTQRPFAGNRIPLERLNPVGKAIAALYPIPNRSVPGANFISAPVGRDDADSFDLRLDHAFSQKSELTARYSFGDRNLFEPFSGATFSQVPGYGSRVPRRAQNAMLGETHVFTPSLISELRLSYSRVAIGVFQQNQGTSLNQQVGLPELSQNQGDWGLSFISTLGYSPLGDEYNNPQRGVSNSYQITEQLTWVRGANTFRFGGDIRKLEQNAYRHVQSRGFLNFIGFTGASLSDLLLGLPVATGGAQLDNAQHLRGESYNLFAQWNRQASRRLSLNFGIRYEFNSAPVDPQDRANLYDESSGGLVQAGSGSMPRAGYASDRNNFGPRAGFAYRVGQGSVVRGGYGFYFDQSSLAPSEGLYFNAPYFDFRFYLTSSQFPLTLYDPFPANYPFPTPPSGFAFQRDLRTPYLQHWSLHLQQELGTGRVVEAGYVGSKGTKLYGARDINQPLPSAAQFNPRPNLRFDDITKLESRADSNYHSLQGSFRQQMRGGVTLLASYTLGKSIDDASSFFPSAADPNFPQNSLDTRAERARSNFDVRQRFVLSYSWLLPSPSSKARWLLGGWQTNGIWSFQSGRPFTVALPSELDNSGTGRSTLGFGANDRPDVLRDARLDSPTPERWFDTAAFAVPARGTFGNAGRNILDGPGFASINLSLMKNFTVHEGVTVQFRAEGFNTLNRANFDSPQAFIGGPAFGSVTSAQPARHVQLGLKLLF